MKFIIKLMFFYIFIFIIIKFYKIYAVIILARKYKIVLSELILKINFGFVINIERVNKNLIKIQLNFYISRDKIESKLQLEK